MEKSILIVGAVGVTVLPKLDASVSLAAVTGSIPVGVPVTVLKESTVSFTVLQPQVAVAGVTVLTTRVPVHAITLLDAKSLDCATVLQPTITDVNSLRLESQTITDLIDCCSWEAACPWLTVAAAASALTVNTDCAAVTSSNALEKKRSATTTATATVTATVIAPVLSETDLQRRRLMRERGFFKVLAQDVHCDRSMLSRLEAGVHKLVSLGHAPNAIMMYDEAWVVGEDFRELLERITGNVASGDCVAFLVEPGFHVFAGPHRDKPNAGDSSFRRDIDASSSPPSPSPPCGEKEVPGGIGMPMYNTAWLSLSTAAPEQSCLYFLPANKDPGYRASGDAILQALEGPHAWPRIEAQPCLPGDLLCFSHRLLHWGGEASPAAAPRVALSYAFADPDFEESAFCSSYLPIPPIELRLALISGQAIVYNSQCPLTKGQLALNNRIFLSQKRYFKEAYVEKVMYAAQSLKFMMAQKGRK